MRTTTIAAGVALLAASCDAFSGLGGGMGVLRGAVSARAAQEAAKCLSLRMSTGGHLETGRGSEADIAAAYFKDQEAFKQQEAEDALKPKRVFEEVDPEQAAWKAQKDAEKEAEEAAVEAKMAMWMKAAADKKAAGGA